MDAEPEGRNDADPGHAAPPVTGRSQQRWLRRILVAVLIVVVVVVLFTWVFPWVESLQQDPTIGTQVLRAPR